MNTNDSTEISCDMRPNEGRISKAYLNSLPSRVTSKYPKVSRNEAIFHAIVDLWRIYSDVEVNEKIGNFVSILADQSDAALPASLAQAAVNDLLAANLLHQTITPALARKIRSVLFGRDDLHGVARADLFNPRDGSVENPFFAMVSLGGLYPGLYKYLRLQRSTVEEEIKNNPTGESTWCAESMVPVALVTTLLSGDYGCFVEVLDFEYSASLINSQMDLFSMQVNHHATQISQFASWQVCPVLLKFDALMLKMLSNTKTSQKIPRDILRHFPYWSACIETPGLKIGDEDVLYLMLSFDSRRGVPGSGLPINFLALNIIAYGESETAWPFSPHSYSLLYDSIHDQLQADEKRAYGSYVEPDVVTRINNYREQIIKIGVQIALYLASDEPDYSGRLPAEKLGRSSKLPSASAEKNPHEFSVGQTVSSAIRKLSEKHGDVIGETREGRSSVRPHWRAAHYQLYWVGKGRTEKRVRWIAPTPVNISAGDQLPVIVREVEGDIDDTSLSAEDAVLDSSFFMPGTGGLSS